VVSFPNYRKNVKKKSQKISCIKFPKGSLSIGNATVLPDALGSTVAFPIIIIIINSILSPLTFLLLLHAAPTLHPFLLLLFVQAIPPWFLHRERLRRRRQGGRRCRRRWSIFHQRRSEDQPVQRVILRRSESNPGLELAGARSKSAASATSQGQRRWRNHHRFPRKSKFA
jgi:hypothetical protein